MKQQPEFKLPEAVNTEKAILGAILLYPVLIEKAATNLKSDAIFIRSHKIIYEAMLALNKNDQPIDDVTLTDYLRNKNQFEAVGGYSYIASLIDGVPRSDNIDGHIKIVNEKARARRFRIELQNMGSLIDDGEPFEVVKERAEQVMFELVDKGDRGGYEDIAVTAAKLLEFIEQKTGDDNVMLGLPTGFKDLDERTLGLMPGVTIVAAQSSIGKTSLMLNICKHNALELGKSVFIYSAESRKEQLTMRILAAGARVDSRRMRQNQMTREEWSRLAGQLSKLSTSRFAIDDEPHRTWESLLPVCRAYKMKHGLDLLCIDYVQLMHGYGDSLPEQARHVSNGLVALSRKLDVPILALSQETPRRDSSAAYRPTKHDLAWSQSWGQDADVVIFLTPEPDTNGEVVRFIFDKQRDGTAGEKADLLMAYSKQYVTFQQLAHDWQRNEPVPKSKPHRTRKRYESPGSSAY